MKKFLHNLQQGLGHFWKQTFSLLTDHVFIALTVIGNLFILGNVVAFYYLEKGVNPNLNSWLDSLWLVMATVTTVGYGDVTPVTDAGKVLGLILMIGGIATFLAFTALFAKALVGQDIEDMDQHMKRMEKMMRKILAENQNSSQDSDQKE